MIICTETPGRNSMSANLLGNYFINHNYKIIKNPNTAILLGLDKLTPQCGMAIIGSHYLGTAISRVFKISFDKY